MNINNSIAYSVSQLNNLAKSYLEKKSSSILVKGEISSLKKYPSGFIYITLKDKNSEINCVVYPDVSNISKLEVGYDYTFVGYLSIYAPKGRFQFIIKSFKRNDLGSLWENYIFLKKKLEKEGLFNDFHKKRLPAFPFDVGIVSSLEGAVIHDMKNVFKRRSPHIFLHIKPTRVQGNDADIDIVDAINYFNKKNMVDLIIIARGGGSFEDLNCFNSEKVARNIALSDIPIVTAIGHETDFTIADFVSDVRASTPSVAAEIISQSTEDIQINMKNLTDRITSILNDRLESCLYQVKNMNNHLKLDNLLLLIDRILDNKKYLDRMMNYNLKNRLSFLENEIKSNKKRILNNDLNNILNKGFALLSNSKGGIVSSINNVKLRDQILIKLNDGKIGARVIEKKYKKNK
ncbi:MAG: exodeoxyribonuclease VII large subunit [Candidatus Marinimicrobia bacterium]|nr:exodeoxyribonuclease VII large subunit [Candidatus Neomarinimicrobiota bacterium]